eukprot:TRINITY_DN35197_c0_g1_i1.p1 TRINITY_DN35197_c0_g1~~TRINITY_DN35197_c0_g1_i1.p1  ORF type:complete len:371 (-),score=62.79 TRINITY_DN35197_c0_g1_i1:531-1643(-)
MGQMLFEELDDGRGLIEYVAKPGLADAFARMLDHPVFLEPSVLDKMAAPMLRKLVSKRCELHIASLLECGRLATIEFEGRCNILHHAANAKILRTLLADERLATEEQLNGTDNHGCTALFYASNLDCCRLILEHPLFHSVNKVAASGTALHWARNPQVCRAILQAPGFNAVDAVDEAGLRAVHKLALKEANFLELMQSGRQVQVNGAASRDGSTPLHYAATEGVCNALFEAGFNDLNAVNRSGNTALHVARNVGVVRAIVGHRTFTAFDVEDENGFTPLCKFAATRRSDMVLAFVEAAKSRGLVAGRHLHAADALGYLHVLDEAASEALVSYAEGPAATLEAPSSETPLTGDDKGLFAALRRLCTFALVR